MVDQLKSAIITVAVLLLILLGYIFLSFDTTYEIDVALEEHLRGENQKALEALNELEGSLKDGQIPLYKSYIFRDEGDLKKSEALLEQAEAQARDDTKTNTRLEIYLNQAYNAYLEGHPDKMALPIERAEQVAGSNNTWVRFFKGLEQDRKGKGELTTKLLEEAKEAIPLSAWMRHSFKKSFSSSWFFSQKARKLISEGQYVQARQLLQEGMAKQTEWEEEETNLLVGLTYIEEGKQKPPRAATPYYKLALSYFERLPIQKQKYQKERRTIISTLAETSGQLIKEEIFQPLNFYAAAFEELKAGPELQELSNGIVKMLLQEIDAQNWRAVQSMTLLLTRILPPGELREMLSQKFGELLNSSLEAGDLRRVLQYWEAASAFSNDPSEMTKDFSRETAKKITAVVSDRQQPIEKALPYIAFWTEIEKNPKTRERFAEKLVALSEKFWEIPGEEKRATAIMQFAKRLPPPEQQFELDDRMGEILLAAFNRAEGEERYERLPFIFNAAKALNLTSLDFQSAQQTQRQLHKARYLFANQDYAEAKKIAAWILTLYPKDEPSRMIVGLSDYFDGKWQEALKILRTIPNPNEQMRRAIAVSRILTGEEQKGVKALEALEESSEVPMTTWLQLGFGKLMQAEPKEGRRWLDKAQPFNDEAYIGLAYAEILENDWEGALRELDKVSPPSRDRAAVKQLRLLAFIHLGDKERAEKALAALNGEKEGEAPPSQPFSLFYKKRLAQFNKEYLAALYYRNLDNNPEKALEALQAVSSPTAKQLLLKAKILIQLKRYKEAGAALAKAEKRAEKLGDARLALEILPVLAEAKAQSGNLLEAYLAFLRYFTLAPENIEHRPAYAKVLMGIRRYDLAAEQFEKFLIRSPLNDQENLLYLKSLIRSDRFGEANRLAENLIAKDPPLAPAERFRIASLLTATGNRAAISQALEKLPPPGKEELETVIEKIRFFTRIGRYEESSKLVAAQKERLQQNPEGLMAEAELLAALSKKEEALQKAREAAKLAPESPEIRSFIQKHAPVSLLLENLKRLQKQIKTEPEGPKYSKRLIYARLLIEAAAGMLQEEKSNQIEISSMFSQAFNILKELSEEVRGVPELLYLQGQVYTLYNNPKIASEMYDKALVLDVSYVEAYLSLAESYRALGKPEKAKEALLYALHFAPDNAEAWQQRALLEVERGELIDALSSWKRAIHFRPNNPDLYMAQAKLLLELNNLEDAKAALDKVLELEPDNTLAVKLLLRALYAPGLELNGSKRALQKEREAALQKLEKLDPEAAALLREKLRD